MTFKNFTKEFKSGMLNFYPVMLFLIRCSCIYSFDIRSEDLDQPFMPVIDFTPYLKFIQV